MNTEDTLLGVVVTGEQTVRTYTSHKIEYSSDTELAKLLTVTEEVEKDDGTTELVDVPIAKSETTLEEYVGEGSLRDKSGASSTDFNRRLLVEDATTRDTVTADLDGLGISYTTEPFGLTQKQKQIVEREGATNANQIQTALKQKGSLFDRSLVTEEDLTAISNEVQALTSDAPKVAKAASRVGYVLTGDERFKVPDIGAMLSVEDGQLLNDGTETETITVSSGVDRDIDAVLEVDGAELPVVIPASSEYTQDITTTKTAGSTIEVQLMGIFNEPTSVTIEVTN